MIHVSRKWDESAGHWCDHPEFALFTGGQDIDPSIYGETNIASRGISKERDKTEISFFEDLPQDLLKIGICRGAQLLCALSGGKLYQDVDNHSVSHECRFLGGRDCTVTSLHHQMMYPPPDSSILGWTHNRSTKYVGIDKRPPIDYEVIYIPSTHAFCIQGHPEFGTADNKFIEILNKLIRIYG